MVNIPAQAVDVIPNAAALIKGWLPSGVADALAIDIVHETYVHWQAQTAYGPGGRRFDRGHTMSRFGDPGITYSFKGTPKPMHSMTPALNDVRSRVSATLGWTPNCVVVNTYAPSSGLYPHRDGAYIPQLGDNPVIVGVSFGATRTFNLHPWDAVKRRRVGEPVSIQLGNGDLLIMYGDCDANFHHSIPEEPHVVGNRVSLTFRQHIS